LIAVTGRPIDPLSWFTPARWGLAATASTTDLTVLTKDSHWKHTAAAWSFDILMLIVVSVLYAGLTRWRLRLRIAR
jgi:hypothetical protein